MKYRDLLGGNAILLNLIIFVVVSLAVFEYKNYRLGQKKQELLLEHERLTKEFESLFCE